MSISLFLSFCAVIRDQHLNLNLWCWWKLFWSQQMKWGPACRERVSAWPPVTQSPRRGRLMWTRSPLITGPRPALPKTNSAQANGAACDSIASATGLVSLSPGQPTLIFHSCCYVRTGHWDRARFAITDIKNAFRERQGMLWYYGSGSEI